MPSRKSRKQSNPLLPVIVIALGVILILAAIIIVNLTSPGTLAGSNQNQPITNNAQVPRVELGDAKAAYDQKKAVFIDVRDAGLFASSHIPGALSIPGDELDNRMNELDPDTWYITYCT